MCCIKGEEEILYDTINVESIIWLLILQRVPYVVWVTHTNNSFFFMKIENVWVWSDIVQLLAGFILFILGIWIGRNQERTVNLTKRLIQEMRSLQTGVAELQMYEKIGVIGWGLKRVSSGEPSAASALLYDCLALLPMLEFSGERLADEYISLLYQSLTLLTDHWAGKENMSSTLANYSLRQVKILKIKNIKELADEITSTLARYLDVLRSKDQQKAEEICSQFLEAEQVKQILNTEIGETYKIMKILASSNRSL